MKKFILTLVMAAMAFVYKNRRRVYGLMVVLLAVGFSAYTQGLKPVKKSLNEESFVLDQNSPSSEPSSWTPAEMEAECPKGDYLCGISFDTDRYPLDSLGNPSLDVISKVIADNNNTNHKDEIGSTGIIVYKLE